MTDQRWMLRFTQTVLVGFWAALVSTHALAGEPPKKASEIEVPPDFQYVSIDDLLVSSVFVPDLMKARPIAADPSPVIKRIQANWQARHEKIQTFHMAWNFWGSRLGTASKPDSQTEVWVERDLRHRVVNSAPLDRVASISAFDGMRRREWNAQTRQGEIFNGEQWDALNNWSTRIWLTALDPMGCDFIAAPSPPFRVLQDNAVIGNRHCVKLERHIEAASWPSHIVETIWVDPQRDDVIAGWERRSPEASFFFVAIEYVRDPHYGWLPAHWDHSTAATSASATTTKLTINERFPIETFRLLFPPGTTVNDRGLAARYEIAANGSQTNVQPYYPAEIETIYDCLREKTDFLIDAEPLKDALEFIAKRYHMKTAIDAEAVRRGLIDPLVEVKTARRGIKLSELLDLLLKQSPKPLKYEIRSDVVTVISASN
jgi:hypothetical protein